MFEFPKTLISLNILQSLSSGVFFLFVEAGFVVVASKVIRQHSFSLHNLISYIMKETVFFFFFNP